jgi:hypothetical protein
MCRSFRTLTVHGIKIDFCAFPEGDGRHGVPGQEPGNGKGRPDRAAFEKRVQNGRVAA